MKSYDLVVASHLRWSFVWQRPQQLLSRLAEHHRILFVEEPMFASNAPGESVPVLQEVAPNLVVLTPRVDPEQCGDTPLWLWPCADQITEQVQDAMRALRFDHTALWFYTPIPDFMVDAVRPDFMVYDVMDELANFKFAPAFLKERETKLLSNAGVVFTGGASLYDGKKHINPNTHLFASGVDSKHYASACHPDTSVPEWMEKVAGPRAAYIGVIDERLDYELIEAAAAARPDVQFFMCGPVVKVNPEDLPKAANLHYPGQQQYADLPRILKGADVCLMPFARNEATKFISPTKTLEYMATHRPIVSTPIVDVKRFYSDIVYLAETAEEFIAQLDAALTEAPEVRSHKRRREEMVLSEQAWDVIVENMKTLMDREWEKTPAAKRASTLRRTVSPLTRTRHSRAGEIASASKE